MTENYLEKYNPKTDIFSQFKVDEALPKEELAFAYWKALVTAKRNHDGLFLVIGKLLRDVRDKKLFKTLDYENFSQFLASEELGFSREKAYLCIRVYEYFVEQLQLNPQKVGEMNVGRLSMMIPILKKLESKEEVIKQIEDLTSLRHGEFVREIKSKANQDGKPSIYWSEELEKWIVNYYDNTTFMQSLGDYENTVK